MGKVPEPQSAGAPEFQARKFFNFPATVNIRSGQPDIKQVPVAEWLARLTAV